MTRLDRRELADLVHSSRLIHLKNGPSGGRTRFPCASRIGFARCAHSEDAAFLLKHRDCRRPRWLGNTPHAHELGCGCGA